MIGLLHWQWKGYPRYHASRVNLLLHIVVVPVFLASNVALLFAITRGAWLWALLAIAVAVASIVVQGIGHRREPVPPEPFTSPFNAIARILCEQWVTFPRFVLSGGWWRALRSAG
jgi:hypothetical protein